MCRPKQLRSRDERSNDEEAAPFAPSFYVDEREDSAYAHGGNETVSVNKRQQAGDEASGEHPRADAEKGRWGDGEIVLQFRKFTRALLGSFSRVTQSPLLPVRSGLPPLREHNHSQRNSQQEPALRNEETRHRISPAPALRHVRQNRIRVFDVVQDVKDTALDRKSTRLNSSHDQISYAVFC